MFSKKMRWCVVLYVSSLVGCGVKPPDPAATSQSVGTPQAAGSQTPSSSSTTPVAEVVDQGELQIGESPASSTTKSPVEQGESTNQQPITATKEQSKPATQAKPIAPSTKWVKPVATVTAEQEAAWRDVDFAPLQLVGLTEIGKVGGVFCTAAARDGQALVLAGTRLSLWSPGSNADGQVLIEKAHESKDAVFTSIEMAPDGKWFAVGDSEGGLRVWQLADRKEVVAKTIDKNDIVDISISPNGAMIATISFDSTVSIWSADQLTAKNKFKVSTNGIKRIEFLSDSSIVALGEKALVCNVETGKQEKALEGDRYQFTVGRSTDGKSMFLGSEKSLRQLLPADAKLESMLQSEFASTELLAPSPDDKHLATGNGNTIRIWDLTGRRIVQAIDAIGAGIVGMHWLSGSNLLVVISDDGTLRLWGNVQSAAAAKLKPLHEPLPKLSGDSKVSAFPRQLMETVDFRTLPTIPGSEIVIQNQWSLNCNAPLKGEEAKLFYRYILGRRGWLESSEPSNNPNGLSFAKDGFMLTAGFYDSGDGKTNVSLDFAGNYDLRWAPKLSSESEPIFESENVVMYSSKAGLIPIEVELLKAFYAAGWKPYARLFASQNETEDRRDLKFLNDGIELLVSIGPTANAPDRHTIQYSRFLTQNSLPIPADCSFVEFDGSTRPALVATSSMDLSAVQAFYDDQMVKQGWIVRKTVQPTKEEFRFLGYVQHQKSVLIALRKLENGKTQILVGEQLENSSWQLAHLKPQPKKVEGGLEAVDFPILNEDGKAKYDPREKAIEFVVKSTTLAALAEKYSEAMAKLGWPAEKGGVRSEEYTFFNFEKGKQEIAFRARSKDGDAEVNIQGDGLLWTKPLPGGIQKVSYAAWLRFHKLPATLELLDRYQSEMK